MSFFSLSHIVMCLLTGAQSSTSPLSSPSVLSWPRPLSAEGSSSSGEGGELGLQLPATVCTTGERDILGKNVKMWPSELPP